MVTPDEFAERIAEQLDRYSALPDEALWEITTREGACMWLYANDAVPEWTGNDHTDRELAARVCTGCPVRHQCLELQFRTAGELVFGVWGALSEEDQEAVYPVWLEHRRRTGLPEPDGGQSE